MDGRSLNLRLMHACTPLFGCADELLLELLKYIFIRIIFIYIFTFVKVIDLDIMLLINYDTRNDVPILFSR